MHVSSYATIQQARRGMAEGQWQYTLHLFGCSAYVSKHAAMRAF